MKSKVGIACAVVSIGLAAVTPMLAHHSFAAEFDASKAIRLVGTLTKIEWTNPHSSFRQGANPHVFHLPHADQTQVGSCM